MNKNLFSQDMLYVKLSRKVIKELALRKVNQVNEFEDLEESFSDIKSLIETANQTCDDNLDIIKKSLQTQ